MGVPPVAHAHASMSSASTHASHLGITVTLPGTCPAVAHIARGKFQNGQGSPLVTKKARPATEGKRGWEGERRSAARRCAWAALAMYVQSKRFVLGPICVPVRPAASAPMNEGIAWRSPGLRKRQSLLLGGQLMLVRTHPNNPATLSETVRRPSWPSAARTTRSACALVAL